MNAAAIAPRWHAALALALLIAGPLAAYWPTITHDYAFRDDYAHLREVRDEPGKITRFTASNGRPIYGLLLEATVRAAVRVADLRWLRLTGTLLLIATGLLLGTLLHRHGWSLLEASAGGLALTLLPAAQMVASWAISWPNALALLLALAGFAAIDAGCGRHGGRRAAAFGVGWLGYLAASLTYPSNALFAVVPLAAAALLSAPEQGRGWRWALTHVVLLGGGLAAALVLMKLLFALGIFPEAARIRFEHDPLAKLVWFIRMPLANALALFALRDRYDYGATQFWWLVALVTLWIVAGFAFAWQRRQARRWLACVLLLPLLGHAVSLAAAERAIGYRTIFPLAGLVIVFALYTLRGLRLTGVLRGPLPAVLLGVAGVFAAHAARDHAFKLIAEPQGREWALVRDAVAAFPFPKDARIYLIRPTRDDRSTVRSYADEFGSSSADSDWVPREMVRTALRERFAGATPPPYRFEFGYAEPPAASYDLVIDLRVLKRLRPGRE
ncbi:MAG: hypothetical protein IT494_05930 [Gammaproteobacteria bacterium]|nr:hypothetical protein [Gammaproteobacteria bacterium]